MIESLGSCISHFVEVRATFISIKMIEEFHYSNIIVMGDSKNVIELFKRSTPSSWEFSSMIKEARGILDQVEDLVIVHNYREANVVVDRLANDAMVLLGR